MSVLSYEYDQIARDKSITNFIETYLVVWGYGEGKQQMQIQKWSYTPTLSFSI